MDMFKEEMTINANDIMTLDLSGMNDEARESLRDSTLSQAGLLGEMGVISMLAIHKSDSNSYVLRVPREAVGGIYQLDLSQLTAFVLGASAALEMTRDHFTDHMTPGELLVSWLMTQRGGPEND